MKYTLIIMSLVFLLRCNSEDAWDCLQKEGQPHRYEISVEDEFKNVKIFDDINIKLHESDEEAFFLETGSNLLPEIEVFLDTGSLHIVNYNACKWTRKPENVTLHVYTNRSLHYQMYGYGSFFTPDTVRHTFRVTSRGSGDADIKLNNARFIFHMYSLMNLNLSGKTETFSCYIRPGEDGRVNATHLETDGVSIVHNGYNDVLVSPEDRLRYEIHSSGNIILTQKPYEIIEVERTGTGKLIQNY